MAFQLLIGVVIFTMLAVFVLIVIYVRYTTEDVTPVSEVLQEPPGFFGDICLFDPCQSGLQCDEFSYVCKSQEGELCDSKADCANELICSGRCGTGPTGTLNQLCPCDSGLTCVQSANGWSYCKGLGGTVCEVDSDCQSLRCIDGVCAAGLPDAAPCTSSDQCANVCQAGFCQPLGVFSGEIKSRCAAPCAPFEGAQCRQGLVCACVDGVGEPGVCVATNAGILDPCAADEEFCAPSLTCYNTTGGDCDSELCACYFPYLNPNQLIDFCVEGMSPIGQQCFNNNQRGCSIGGMCASGNCGGPPAVSQIAFRLDDVNTGTNFQSATSTAILPTVAFNLPGVVDPHRLFVFSPAPNIDNIYIVDRNIGLARAVYNPLAESPLLSWTILTPGTFSVTINSDTYQAQLLDAQFNGTNYLVALRLTDNSQTFDGLYIRSSAIPDNTYTPFNEQPGPGFPGTQYTTDNIPLTIDFVDRSVNNDIMITTNNTAFRKLAVNTAYSTPSVVGGTMDGMPVTNVRGRVSFYFDTIQNPDAPNPPSCPFVDFDTPVQCPAADNFAFVADFLPPGGVDIIPDILQYSGNLAGIAFPVNQFNSRPYIVDDYSIFSPQPEGMIESATIALTQIDNIFVIAINRSGTTTIVPYQASGTVKVAVGRGFYVFNIASCI